MRKKTRRAGYTLIEAMIVVAIVGIVASVGANVLIEVNRYWILTTTRSELQREARASMYVITRELRQAQSATIVIDRVTSSQPFYSRITFTTDKGTTMSFEQSGNELLQVVGSNTKILSQHLAYMAFTLPETDVMSMVSVSMTMQGNIYQGQTKALHMASEEVQVMN